MFKRGKCFVDEQGGRWYFHSYSRRRKIITVPKFLRIIIRKSVICFSIPERMSGFFIKEKGYLKHSLSKVLCLTDNVICDFEKMNKSGGGLMSCRKMNVKSNSLFKIHCDFPGCSQWIVKAGWTESEARKKIIDSGWSVGEHDICPHHKKILN